MTIKVREEDFGYVLFRQADRKYFIVEKELGGQSLLSLVRQYFPEVVSLEEIIAIPSLNALKDVSLSSPIGMYLEISQKCNLNCKHCYKPADISCKDLTLEQTKTLIDELASMGVFEIRLCGNEPTTSKQ